MSGLSRTRISWADYVWNPIFGCRNGCPYCYAREAAPHIDRQRAAKNPALACPQCRAFEPHFHQERIDAPEHTRMPGIIFADSMADWWSPGVEQAWRTLALAGMTWACQHRYVVLTKRPDLIPELDALQWVQEAWLGVSITCGEDWWRWQTLAALETKAHKFISVEPLLGPGVGERMSWSAIPGWHIPELVIVGPQSGRDAKRVDVAWQRSIRRTCGDASIPLFEKAGLPLTPAIRQMPPSLAAVFQKKETLT